MWLNAWTLRRIESEDRIGSLSAASRFHRSSPEDDPALLTRSMDGSDAYPMRRRGFNLPECASAGEATRQKNAVATRSSHFVVSVIILVDCRGLVAVMDAGALEDGCVAKHTIVRIVLRAYEKCVFVR